MFNNINNKSWFNNKVLFIISLVIMSFSSFISVFAVSSYLYNSNEVSFNNSSSSSINSSNVQGAIDELYADAHNYEEMSGRVATLEGRWSATNNRVLDIGKDTTATGTRGVRIFDANGKDRSYIVFNSDTTQIVANGSTGSDSAGWAKGTLELQGNPVKVNGVALEPKWDLLGGACSLNKSAYANYTISNISNYFFIRINSSYYSGGLPDYGGVTIPVTELKRATSEAITILTSDSTRTMSVKYVNDTTISVRAGSSSTNICFSVHGVL